MQTTVSGQTGRWIIGPIPAWLKWACLVPYLCTATDFALRLFVKTDPHKFGAGIFALAGLLAWLLLLLELQRRFRDFSGLTEFDVKAQAFGFRRAYVTVTMALAGTVVVVSFTQLTGYRLLAMNWTADSMVLLILALNLIQILPITILLWSRQTQLGEP
jgi:hypothetical protein